MRFRSMLTALLLVLCLGSAAHAGNITQKESETFFWKIVDRIQNESPEYFTLFSDTAKVVYTWPESYMMGPRTVSSFNEFKDGVNEFWAYSENHSFDLKPPKIVIQGDRAVVTALFFERYTLGGYTLENKARHTYVLARGKGGIKIVEFTNHVSEITEKGLPSAPQKDPVKTPKKT